MSHASGCSYLAAIEREEVQGINATMGAEAPSVKLINMQKKLDDAPVAKKLQIEVGSSSAPGNPTLLKIKPSDTHPSVIALSRKAKAEQLTLQLDLDVLQWMVVSGIPPTVVDLCQWKTMWQHAAPIYTPASSSKLVDHHLP